MLDLVKNMLYFGLLFIDVINKLGGTVAEEQGNHTGLPCQIKGVSIPAGLMYGVDCTGLGLTSVPACNQLPIACSLVTELILKNNQIRKLTPGRLGEYRNLKQLDLSGNPIRILENGSFQGLLKLLRLTMRRIQPDSECVHIEKRTFGPLKSIKVLDLSFSQLNMRSLVSAFCLLSKNIQELALNGVNCERDYISMVESQTIVSPVFFNLSNEKFKFLFAFTNQ